MASNKKLNPNAAPYTIFPRYVVTRSATEQLVMALAPFQSEFLYYQHVPRLGYHVFPMPFHVNLNTQTSYFVPSNCGKGFDFMGGKGFEAASNEFKKGGKRRKMRNITPRFSRKTKMVSLGAKGQQWLPKNLTGEETKPVKKETKGSFGGKTSLMIRNIPNQFQRHNLLQILDKHCLKENKNKANGKSAYDFLYLPMDFKTGGNLGYAFVNFTNNTGATRFFKAFNNYEWNVPVNKKTCKVCCANIQGKIAFTNHFKNSIFSCDRNDYLPIVLSPPSDGVVSSRFIVIGRHCGTKINSSRSSESHHALKD